MRRSGSRPTRQIFGLSARCGNVTPRVSDGFAAHAIPSRRTKVRHQLVANIKSQKKRILTNAKATARNKAVKSALRTHVRKFREAVEAGDVEKAQQYAKVANRALDKAASKGVIHANQAANRKSAISARAAAL